VTGLSHVTNNKRLHRCKTGDGIVLKLAVDFELSTDAVIIADR